MTGVLQKARVQPGEERRGRLAKNGGVAYAYVERVGVDLCGGGRRGWEADQEPESHLSPHSHLCITVGSSLKAGCLNIFLHVSKDHLLCLSFCSVAPKTGQGMEHTHSNPFGCNPGSPQGWVSNTWCCAFQLPVFQGLDKDYALCLFLSLIHPSIHPWLRTAVTEITYLKKKRMLFSQWRRQQSRVS